MTRRKGTRNGTLEVLASEITDTDWKDILSARFTKSQQKVVEYLKRNHNAPTSLRTLRQELEDIPQYVRESICDNLRKANKPFLLVELPEEAYQKIPFADKEMHFVRVLRTPH